jgi:hypothetical protein
MISFALAVLAIGEPCPVRADPQIRIQVAGGGVEAVETELVPGLPARARAGRRPRG